MWSLYKLLTDGKPLKDATRDDGRKLVAHFEAQGLRARPLKRKSPATVAANTPQAAVPNIYLLAAAKQQRDQTLDAVMQGCMSKRGYLFVQVPNAPR